MKLLKMKLACLLTACCLVSFCPLPSFAIHGAETCTKGEFPLHWAVRENDVPRITELIKKGADLNTVCYGDQTPFLFAVSNGNLEVISLFLQSGVKVAGHPQNSRALNYLSASSTLGDRVDIAQTLLDAGAEVNSDDWPGPPLLLAAEHGNMNIVRLLLSKGANLNAQHHSKTALFAAAKSGKVEMVKFLLSAGATITDEDYLNAAYDCNLLILHYFIKNGGNVNIRNRGGATALHLSAGKLYGGYKDCSEFLLQSGADINARDSRNATPLHSALRSLDFHPYSGTWFVEKLIAMSADLNVKNSQGLTPLDLAQKDPKNASIANILIQAGAKNGSTL